MSESSSHTPENSAIPVHDTPKTPLTPGTPVSVLPEQNPGFKPSEGGIWTRLKHSTETLYNPPSLEVAKRFLRTAFRTELTVPTRLRRSPNLTTLSSGPAIASPVPRMQSQYWQAWGQKLNNLPSVY